MFKIVSKININQPQITLFYLKEITPLLTAGFFVIAYKIEPTSDGGCLNHKFDFVNIGQPKSLELKLKCFSIVFSFLS